MSLDRLRPSRRVLFRRDCPYFRKWSSRSPCRSSSNKSFAIPARPRRDMSGPSSTMASKRRYRFPPSACLARGVALLRTGGPVRWPGCAESCKHCAPTAPTETGTGVGDSGVDGISCCPVRPRSSRFSCPLCPAIWSSYAVNQCGSWKRLQCRELIMG